MKRSIFLCALTVVLTVGIAHAQPPCNPSTYAAFGVPGQSACLEVCPGSVLQIHVYGPLGPNQTPVLGIMAGCEPVVTRCEYECPFYPTGIYWSYDPTSWRYNSIDGSFDVEIFGLDAGCLCVTLAAFLPVEMGRFTAIAGDGSVTLNWNTISETNVDRFEVLRRADGEEHAIEIGHIQAQNTATGADYSYTDNQAVNGIQYEYSLAIVNLDGSREATGLIAEATPVSNEGLVRDFALYQNLPNPFNPSTKISFNLESSGEVNLSVFDLNGRLVAALVEGALPSGSHSVNFDGHGLPSGLYFYRLTAGVHTATRSMLLLK